MRTLILFVLALGVLPAAGASEDGPGAAPGGPLAIPALPFLDSVAAEGELGQSTAASILAATRGREDTASAVLGGVVTGNSATQVSTGANTITGGAFANMSGLPVVIQNSGANVLIQNATVINLQLR
ncbi:hypothetical protein KY495_15300 [Massilia sp. PAMC28688]|uniref:hypothetical protein n=1 Tax=Massilia sp. PAMC28688 TaxID=2861283 RepID=UPI001C639B4F|nr:hypothetical protein [Massilia sp. PAMC28688]QYF96233.1 hypothetical protein KY495_15300 [Massilia sp. PAMC28688]